MKTTIDKYGPFVPQNTFNVDESGLITVKDTQRVYAKKNIKHDGTATTVELEQVVTTIVGINAIGNHVSLLLVFHCVNYKSWTGKDAPPRTTDGMNASGWTNDDIFIEYLKHFITFTHASLQKKVLIVLNNHDTHLKDKAIKFYRENGICVVTFWSHANHKTQTLDQMVFGPLKTCDNEDIENWLQNHLGQTCGIYDIPEAPSFAYPKGFISVNIVSGFRYIGIYIFNEDIFPASDYLSSYVTDRSTNRSTTIYLTTPAADVMLSTSADKLLSPRAVRPLPKAGP